MIDQNVERAIAQSTDRHELWVRLLADLECRVVCEVGVWTGQFAERMLTEVPGIESYTLIDPWRNLPDWNKPANRSDAQFEEIRAEALGRVAPFAEKVVEIRDLTKHAKERIENGSLDFAYVDGDHTLRGITIDLQSMLPKIRPGGFIGGDDFTKTIWQHGSQFSPTEVFPYAIYFAEALDLTIYTLPFEQFLIVNDPSGFEVKDYGNYADLTPSDIYRSPATTPVTLMRRMRSAETTRRLRAMIRR